MMSLLHYSLDNLSLMALAICTGFVVDDAIVSDRKHLTLSGSRGFAARSAMKGPERSDYCPVDEHFP